VSKKVLDGLETTIVFPAAVSLRRNAKTTERALTYKCNFIIPRAFILCYNQKKLNLTHQIISLLFYKQTKPAPKFAEQTVLPRTNKEEKRPRRQGKQHVLIAPHPTWLIAEQEPGEHEHPAGGGEEREDGQVPGLPPPGPVCCALGLGAEVLGPAQRVHLLEQVEAEALALELGDAPGQEQRGGARPPPAAPRPRSRTASVSDLYRSAQSMASEESSETRQGIHDRLHAVVAAAEAATEEEEERKRSSTEAAWKAKKAQ
jgi:hypothetical protein